MDSLAVGLGLGLVSVITVVVMGFILNYRLVRDADDDKDLRQKAETEAKHELEITVELEKNVAALKNENSDLRTTNEMLVAQLAAAEKVTDDLLHAIETSPTSSALPAALRAQLDRLRSHLSAPAQAVAPGNSPGGENGPVHEATPQGTKPAG